jgi:hypothetical protein
MSDCTNCGAGGLLLVALHGDRGGPDVCVRCSGELLGKASARAKKEGQMFGAMFGAMFRRAGRTRARRRNARGRRSSSVTPTGIRRTAASSPRALRPYVKPRKPPDPPPRDVSTNVPKVHVARPVTDAYPCATCRHLIPFDYCDPCRARWDREREDERERDRAYRRALRARKRAARCSTKCACGKWFVPSRSDQRYCSPACRQSAYRERCTALEVTR